MAPGTLPPVSAQTATRIALAPATVAAHQELAGVFIDVPADSLFADDGTRGGSVGVAPVWSETLGSQQISTPPLAGALQSSAASLQVTVPHGYARMHVEASWTP